MVLCTKMFKILVFCRFLAFSNAAFVDTLEKCSQTDKECLKRVIKGALVSISDSGIPEYDIPPIDPLHVTNMKLNLMDLAELTVLEGTVKGLKDCEVSDLKLQINKGTAIMKLLCDVTAKGQYEVSGSSPALKNIFGAGALKGNGKAKLKAEKLSVYLEFHFDVVRRNGDTYIDCHKEEAKFEFDLLGNSQLKLDNLYIGDVESSKIVTDYYNQNAKTLWKTFGKSLLVSVTDFAYDTLHKFFGNVPTKFYLGDDLSTYVKN